MTSLLFFMASASQWHEVCTCSPLPNTSRLSNENLLVFAPTLLGCVFDWTTKDLSSYHCVQHLRCSVPMFGIIKVLKGVAEAYLKVRLEQNAFRLCFLGYTIVKLNLIHGLNIKWGMSSVFIFHGKKQVNNCCTWI